MTDKERLLTVASNLDGYYIYALKKAGVISDASDERIFQNDIDCIREVAEKIRED